MEYEKQVERAKRLHDIYNFLVAADKCKQEGLSPEAIKEGGRLHDSERHTRLIDERVYGAPEYGQGRR